MLSTAQFHTYTTFSLVYHASCVREQLKAHVHMHASNHDTVTVVTVALGPAPSIGQPCCVHYTPHNTYYNFCWLISG